MLDAFGMRDSMTRRQLSELFIQDEATAFAMVQILLNKALVVESGNYSNYELPE
jgi:hypothetical protein